MSARSAASLRIALGPSRRLAALLAAVHGGAVMIALLLPIAWPARLALAVAAALGLYVTLREHALRTSPRAVVGLEIGDDEAVAVRFADGGDWRECTLEEAWVHPTLALLSLRVKEGRRARVAIAADALPAEAFRRLRVRLRLRTAAG